MPGKVRRTIPQLKEMLNRMHESVCTECGSLFDNTVIGQARKELFLHLLRCVHEFAFRTALREADKLSNSWHDQIILRWGDIYNAGWAFLVKHMRANESPFCTTADLSLEEQIAELEGHRHDRPNYISDRREWDFEAKEIRLHQQRARRSGELLGKTYDEFLKDRERKAIAVSEKAVQKVVNQSDISPESIEFAEAAEKSKPDDFTAEDLRHRASLLGPLVPAKMPLKALVAWLLTESDPENREASINVIRGRLATMDQTIFDREYEAKAKCIEIDERTTKNTLARRIAREPSLMLVVWWLLYSGVVLLLAINTVASVDVSASRHADVTVSGLDRDEAYAELISICHKQTSRESRLQKVNAICGVGDPNVFTDREHMWHKQT
ncbi:hypothetical protein ETAA8_39550 [Anatilimnocola aggregata]|uniref:Uncharacterized protein n=1 Tax=Anatilimnocola aggregata TaxID=2528021 RepID=A0A517YF50_9BACT|nr:hypothetical protein [Anatilimnocola aggregata]QDU28850.1 hypothetical protein ETAA8_39550 [Anatilimnocola aggregata]